MKRLSTPVTVFALAVPAAALLAAHPVLASLDRGTAIANPVGLGLMLAGILAIGVAATAWAGATIWTAQARRRQHTYSKQLHDLVGRFHVAMILTDARGTITAMNAPAESLTGWREATALGLPVGAVFQLVDQRTHGRVVNPVVSALYKDIVVGPSHETLLLTKAGDERQVRDTASPIHDHRGRVVGCALVGRDVDEPAFCGRRVPIQEARH
jgi:PAS domain S-box-containing protein